MKLTWALDKQAKIDVLKDSFSRRYSNFLTSWQKMLDYVEIVNIHKKKYFYYQGKERPAKTKLVPAKLRTVLACAKSDST